MIIILVGQALVGDIEPVHGGSLFHNEKYAAINSYTTSIMSSYTLIRKNKIETDCQCLVVRSK